MQNKLYLPNFNHSPIDIHSHFNRGTPFDTPQTEAHIRKYAPEKCFEIIPQGI